MDLGESPYPLLFWVEKGEVTEWQKASRASKSRPQPPVAQGLPEPPLVQDRHPLPLSPKLKVWIRQFFGSTLLVRMTSNRIRKSNLLTIFMPL